MNTNPTPDRSPSLFGRLLWQFEYARMALRSPYDFNIVSAWQEAGASWEMNQYERGADPMPSPAAAIYEDQFEWKASC